MIEIKMGDTVLHNQHKGFIIDVVNTSMPYEFVVDMYAISGKLPKDYLNESNYRYAFIVPKTFEVGVGLESKDFNYCRMVLVEHTIFLRFLNKQYTF